MSSQRHIIGTLTPDFVGCMLVIGAPVAVESDGDGCSGTSGSRPVSHAAIFMPGFRPAHVAPMAGRPRIQHPQGEEGGSDSYRISNAPASRAAMESLSVGASQRLYEGFSMATSATSASALTISDLDITADEPRVFDLKIAERLGMADPHDIRRTIEANRSELERYGLVHAAREGVSGISGRRPENGGAKRGRPGRGYYLNEAQTLLLCMLSRTDRAADVRQEVIEVFMAYRRGEIAKPAQQKPMTLADMDRARRMVAECRKVHGPRAAQQMWAALGLPGAQPDQTSLAVERPREGHGVIILGGKYVYFDAHDTAIQTGDDVLAVVPMGRGNTPLLEIFPAVVDPRRFTDNPHGERTVLRHDGLDTRVGYDMHRYCTLLGRIVAVKDAA